ncbi:chorismate synthase [Neoconidiobolus thromboides FSU 785]|nr:chorismate synthase [Neoconidiobolus thromboides FSU 785]
MSSFGTIFKVTTYGESHCSSVGCIIENVPPGLEVTEDLIQPQLTRRRPGQSNLTTPRNEADRVKIEAGVEHGVSLGSPIALTVKNLDQRPHDYSETDLYPRPSHADWTYLLKYQLKSSSGGGRSSARETIGRVAAGTIAELYLRKAFNTEIVAFVSQVGKVKMDFLNGEENHLEFMKFLNTIDRPTVDQNNIRCPDIHVSEKMREAILEAKERNDSIGGVVTCVIRNAPKGLGEPCFDKLEAKLAHAMLSIPATKGFEIGSGFNGAAMYGSQHNDKWVPTEGGLSTVTNYSGGIQGGISNGENIYFNIAFKPAATISQEQETCTYDGEPGVLKARGRHDPCVLPRAIPIVEAMASLVIMDNFLIQSARLSAKQLIPNANIHPSLLGKIPTKSTNGINGNH